MKLNFPIREVIFGLEDSLVSTLGVVVGIAVGTDNRYVVVLSALVVIVVESLAMSAGTYLSNKSQMEMENANAGNSFRRLTHLVSTSLKDSIFMGVSYIIGGIISVLPFFFIEPSEAIIPSVIISISTLFSIGFIKGKIVKINPIRSGLEMSLVSLSAAGLGFIVGKFASTYLM